MSGRLPLPLRLGSRATTSSLTPSCSFIVPSSSSSAQTSKRRTLTRPSLYVRGIGNGLVGSNSFVGGLEKGIRMGVGTRVGLFHTTAGTYFPSRKSKKKRTTKNKSQPTSSRRLAQPEVVSSSSSSKLKQTKKATKPTERDRDTENDRIISASTTPPTQKSRKRRRRRRGGGGREAEDEAVGVKSNFERDDAPHPLILASEGSKTDSEYRTRARVEWQRAERDRRREKDMCTMGAGTGMANTLRQYVLRQSAVEERKGESDGLGGRERGTWSQREEVGEFYQPKRLAEGGADTIRGGKGISDAPSSSTTLENGNDKEAKKLPIRFTSPPLLPGFVHALEDMFGSSSANGGDGIHAKPTVIQALSLKWIVEWVRSVFGGDMKSGTTSTAMVTQTTPPGGWRQFLLAAETGSGKSIAYLLPMLQALKMSEGSFVSSITSSSNRTKKLPTYAPRGIVLAPTHELARQLTGFAKELLHYPDAKLKVKCVSKENVVAKGHDKERSRRRGMKGMEGVIYDTERGALEDALKGERPADVIVGTPNKVLDLLRGRGWDRVDGRPEDEQQRRLRDPVAQFGLGSKVERKSGDLALEDVEWVVIDEADVLFDPDFEASTRQLLADISAARGVNVPLPPFQEVSSLPSPSSSPSSSIRTITYPFHLLLTSATIPTSLNTYLSHTHPHLLRLASPGLHKFPKKLAIEYVQWSGGRKEKDVWKRLREVWRDDWVDAATATAPGTNGEEKANGRKVELSQIVIFCNKSSKAEELGAFLSEQIFSSSQLKDEMGLRPGEEGVLVVTGGKGSIGRSLGSNRHLESFLRARKRRPSSTSKPLILVTTSLLSRGLDFAPSVKHVFVVDPPRNKVDFLHRAGRAGRAGMSGRVVVFGRSGEELGRELVKGRK